MLSGEITLKDNFFSISTIAFGQNSIIIALSQCHVNIIYIYIWCMKFSAYCITNEQSQISRIVVTLM